VPSPKFQRYSTTVGGVGVPVTFAVNVTTVFTVGVDDDADTVTARGVSSATTTVVLATPTSPLESRTVAVTV
jgi:hypothetical protein